MKVWVTLDVEDASVIGVAETVELAMAAAETDSGGGSLSWTYRGGDTFTAGPDTLPVYRIQPFNVGVRLGAASRSVPTATELLKLVEDLRRRVAALEWAADSDREVRMGDDL